MILAQLSKFGERVSLARQAKGLTQAALERRCDMAKTWVSQIERGARLPSVPTLAALCAELDVSADWLMGLPSMPTRPR